MAEIVMGYHGTTKEKAEEILSTQTFDISTNKYDWLGRGTYFWQSAPVRAWEWALQKAKRSGFDPAVVGVEIELRDSLDLLDIGYWKFLSRIAPSCLASGPTQIGFAEALGDPHVRGAKFNYADCKLIDEAVAALWGQTGTAVTSVRAAFAEGDPVFDKSWLFALSHVQIAVRDPSVFVGTIERVDSGFLDAAYLRCKR